MADDVSRFKIFGAVSYVSPLSSSDQTVGGITDSVQASNETGYEFGFEFRFGKWVGIEASYVDSSHDIEFGDVTIGQADLKPINLAINIHIIHSKFVDFYLAPVGAYVEWSNLDLSGGGS
jgi:hypothetical protein